MRNVSLQKVPNYMKPFSHQILIVFLVFQGLPQKPSWLVRNPCELNAAYVSFLIKHFNYIPNNMPLIKIITETDFYKNNESFLKKSTDFKANKLFTQRKSGYK